MPSLNIYSAEFGSHTAPSMSPEQAAKARKWANPIAISVIVFLLSVLAEEEGWLGHIPKIIHIGIIALWFIEIVVMLRLTPNNREWFQRNKIDVVACFVGVITLPYFPGELPSFAVLAGFIRFFDIVAVFGKYIKVTGLTYVMIFFPLAVFCGGVAFRMLEVAPDGTVPSLLASFYWAVVALTSVGFGDFSAHTPGAQVLCLLFLPLSPILLALIVSAIVPHMEREIRDLLIIFYRQREHRLTDEEREDLDVLERLKVASEDESGGMSQSADERLEELLRLTREIARKEQVRPPSAD